MPDVNISGGTNTVNVHFPTQQEINLETRNKRVTLVFTDSELDALQKISLQRGYSQLAVFLRKMITKGIRLDKYENLTLGEIVK